MSFVFHLPPTPSVQIEGSDQKFPVHRIYCVGRNYAEHAREMGHDSERELPFFFTKPADAVVPNGATIAYPTRTSNLHHEVELVIALGDGGRDIPTSQALQKVFGYAVGIDLTRRDLQSDAKSKGRPWDTAKGFDHSAPISSITPAGVRGHLDRGSIWLKVNGALRQEGNLADLLWRVPEVIAELSALFELQRGDLIYTGTPAGVGALQREDRIEAGIDGLETLVIQIGP